MIGYNVPINEELMEESFELVTDTKPNRKFQCNCAIRELKEKLEKNNNIITKVEFKNIVKKHITLYPSEIVLGRDNKFIFDGYADAIRDRLKLRASDTDEIYAIVNKTKNTQAVGGVKQTHVKNMKQNRKKAEEDQDRQETLFFDIQTSVEKQEKKDKREIHNMLAAANGYEPVKKRKKHH